MIISLFSAVAMLVAKVAGHGYLLGPPARNSAWRVDLDNFEENFTDNELNCGGFSNQWNTYDGKCGICGDPYQGPYKHEAGGLYAKPHRTVTRCYNKADDAIDIHVVITSHHKGYFEFRLCQHNNMATRADQSCFDTGILMTIRETGLTRYDINENKQLDYFFQLDMPRDVTCTQCILQWKYNAGNNWGCDDTGCGTGLGPQEQFINCADIAILDNCAGGMTTEDTTDTVKVKVKQRSGIDTINSLLPPKTPKEKKHKHEATRPLWKPKQRKAKRTVTFPQNGPTAIQNKKTHVTKEPPYNESTSSASTATPTITMTSEETDSTSSTESTSSASTATPTITMTSEETDSTSSTGTASSTTAPPTGSTFRCWGVGTWNDPFTMQWFCTSTCYHNFGTCPGNMCMCNGAP